MASIRMQSLWSPQLPDHCTPTSPFLLTVSSYFHTCIPTPLAFASVFFGVISIVSWLFAQLPQVIKNFHLRSTSGLSAFFLIEWCLGDFSNLIGAILTQQATWQITLASYYCSVDIVLVGQWIWYEHLKHGRSLRRILSTKYRQQFKPDDVKGPCSSVSTPATTNFHTPTYGSPAIMQSDTDPQKQTETQTQSRTIRRTQAAANPLPSPSPRTFLLISMVVCLCSTTIASPAPLSATDPTLNTSLFQSSNKHDPTSTPAETIGTVISWMSALLYLGSRLPQLIKNARRRSTEGLSPLLFFAAFCGNLFYSSSMLCNPLAWRTKVGPYGEHGWAPADGSTNVAWIANALPFFIGAAGVLIMDGSVGLQFWLFRPRRQHSGGGDDDSGSDRFIIVVGDRISDAGLSRGSSGASSGSTSEPRWQPVNGWMRGWSPGFAALSLLPGTPILRPKRSVIAVFDNENERQPLLGVVKALQHQQHQRQETNAAAAAERGDSQQNDRESNGESGTGVTKTYGGV